MTDSTHVFDVEDAYDSDRVTAVYKCGTCCALVEAGDHEDHAAWHANQAALTPVYGWRGEG